MSEVSTSTGQYVRAEGTGYKEEGVRSETGGGRHCVEVF